MKKKKLMLTFSLAIIIGISSILIAYFQYREKLDEKNDAAANRKEAKENEAEAKKYRLRFESTLEKLNSLQEKNNSLQEQNKELTVENLKLSEEVYKHSIGFNSFPIIVLSGYKSSTLKNIQLQESIDFMLIEFNIINSGNYPLNNVKVSFADAYGKLIGQYITITKHSTKIKGDKSFDTIDKELNLGSIPKKEIVRQIYFTTLPMNLGATYDVNVIWESGSIDYLIEVENRNGKLRFDYTNIYSKNTEINKLQILKTIEHNFTSNQYKIN